MKLDNYVESILQFVKQAEDIPRLEYTDDLVTDLLAIVGSYANNIDETNNG